MDTPDTTCSAYKDVYEIDLDRYGLNSYLKVTDIYNEGKIHNRIISSNRFISFDIICNTKQLLLACEFELCDTYCDDLTKTGCELQVILDNCQFLLDKNVDLTKYKV